MKMTWKRLDTESASLRNSNLELFRILTMLLIVAHHYVVNSGVLNEVYAHPLAGRSVFLLLLGAWGKTGINCFVLITGYFMCQSSITARKFAKLLLPVWFYKILIWMIFALCGREQVSLARLMYLVLPFTDISTGFTQCYLMFFLTIPFLNIVVQKITQLQHIYLLLLCGLMYIVLGTFPQFTVRMNYVSWFMVLYFIGAYLRKYGTGIWSGSRRWGWISLALLAVAVAELLCRIIRAPELGRVGIAYYYAHIADSNKLLAVAIAVSVFLFFRNQKPRYHRGINRAAASCFGVLLIHANSDAMRRWLWQDLLHCQDNFYLPWPNLLLHAAGSVLGVFLVCMCLDQIRIRFLEEPFFRLWDRKWKAVSRRLIHAQDKLCEKLRIEK